MSKRFTLAPITGLKGEASPRPDLPPVPVMFKMFVELWEPGDPPFRRPDTLAEIKRRYWHPATSTLRIPSGDGEFTLGPDVLAGLPETTIMRLQIMFEPRGG